MGEFKRSLKEHKINTSYKKSQRHHYKTSIAFTTVIVSSSVLLLCLIIHFSKTPALSKAAIETTKQTTIEPNEESTSQEDSTTQSTSLEQPRYLNIGEGNVEELYYMNVFVDIYKFMYSKLQIVDHEDTQPFLDSLSDYTKTAPAPTFKASSRIEGLLDEFCSYFAEVSYPQNTPGSQITYNMALVMYSKMVFISYKEFNEMYVENIMELETRGISSSNILKFAFQHLQLQYIIIIVIKCIEAFEHRLIIFIREALKQKAFTELNTKLYSLIIKVKDKLFIEFGKEIEFKFKGENVIASNILRTIHGYWDFLVLNLYVIFVQVFEINERYEVVGIKKYYGKNLIKDLDNIDVKNKVIEKCRNVFLLVMDINNLDTFYKDSIRTLGLCKKTFLGGEY
eukprot:GAHX01004183.1.p1 GENE.GAHX01004183.1~~GAHX01004183.1.p1  ORF type:complete len:396 (-),score=72.50 GAHX01004183.1:37-1224(-)